VVEVECGTEDIARRLAAAMNQRERIRAGVAAFQREANIAARVNGGPRRGVRYFETDEQA
jgi:hypothetical protein